VTRKGRAITLSINDYQKARLEQIALDCGAVWGDKPNISGLVKDIANGRLRVAASHDWTSDRILALNQARLLLIDDGQIETAIALTHLLLERSELTIPLQQELEAFIQQPMAPWRQEIDRLIRRQQPFQLAYQDAAEQVWRFTIRHAQVTRHDGRHYLDCWCAETKDNQDVPELVHNWCFRFDRITDAALSPVSGKWRSHLDQISVEFHLYGGLAFAYESKTGVDVVNEWHPERSEVRRVVRQVSSTFWLFRELLRYGDDCELIAPQSVRDRFRDKILTLAQRYQD
jgi:hypothetical protein